MSAQTETQETEAQSDGPLLDLTDAGVKKFIKQAKARGYVTMEDLNKVLPSEEVTPDAIEDTLDYKRVSKRLLSFVAESQFQLVETLTERIAQIIVTEFKVPWVRVRLNKQGAIRGSRDVGILIERRSEDYAAHGG